MSTGIKTELSEATLEVLGVLAFLIYGLQIDRKTDVF